MLRLTIIFLMIGLKTIELVTSLIKSIIIIIIIITMVRFLSIRKLISD